jgi:hypothetical protein
MDSGRFDGDAGRFAPGPAYPRAGEGGKPQKHKVVSSKPKPRQVTDTPASSSQHPSLGTSSQSDVREVEPVATKPVITCFNCSLPGHYQSNCKAPLHCALYDIDGHTTAMCPTASKQAKVKWYGFTIDGKGF